MLTQGEGCVAASCRYSSRLVRRSPKRARAKSSTLSTGGSAAATAAESKQISWQALRALFVASAVPMVGFGFMDNLVMIQAGQYIDSTLGVKFGLATMTAAAAGQVVSDVSGVLFGGTLETFLNRWMPNPVATRLSMAQRQLPASRYASLAGAVLGVTVGCILGATTLFFVDLDARDRIQRAQQFKQVLADMTHRGSFPCKEVVVHLAVKAHQKYDWKSLNKEDDKGGGGGGSADTAKTLNDGPRVRIQSLDLRDQAKDDNGENQEDLVLTAAQKQDVLVRGQRLFAPIMRLEDDKHDQIWAVVEFEKDGTSSIEEIDIQRIRLMAAHLAIFMHRMAD
jgi:hypothetical protein